MRRFIFAAALLSAAACHKITDNPDSPPTTDRGRVLSANVAVVWLPDVQQVAKACGRTDPALHAITYACAQVELAPDGLTSTCTIYATEPKDFNDKAVIGVLGHEFFHCLGAKHG